MKTLFPRLTLPLAAIALAFTGRAQTPAPSPAEEVKFTAVAWDDLSAEGDLTLHYRRAGVLREANIAWRDRSGVMECDGPGPLVFFKTAVIDGAETEVPVATAEIPEGVSRALLVFGRGRNADGEKPALNVVVLDDSYSVFPGQSVRFMNYTGRLLGGSVGEQKFQVAPRSSQVVPAELPERNRLLPFKLASGEGNGWRRLRSTGLPMTDGLRLLVFLTEDPRNPGKVEMVTLRDQVEQALKSE